MRFEELRRYSEADVAEEVRGVVVEAGEEVEDEGAQGGEVVGESVEMQDVLFELVPELLDGVEPGGVGGQRDDLDGEVEVLGARGGLVGPGARAMVGEGRGLGLEGGEHVGV